MARMRSRRGLRLEDHAVGAGLTDFHGKSFGFMHGVNIRRGCPGQAGNSRRRLESAHFGHGDIQHDHIRLQVSDRLNGLRSVAGFTADLPLGS